MKKWERDSQLRRKYSSNWGEFIRAQEECEKVSG